MARRNAWRRKDAVIEAIDPGWISQFLAVITDPNVAFILLMVGIYGLIFEFMSPGAVAPGVVGTICLLLGLYALNLLPINYAGLALMLVGIALLAIEAFNPTVVIGLGGVIAFVLGAVMLFRVEAPGYRLSWSVIGIVAALFIGFVLVVLGSLLTRSQRSRNESARKPCEACLQRSSIGPRMKVTSLRTVNAGKRAAPKPSSPARWLKSPTSSI